MGISFVERIKLSCFTYIYLERWQELVIHMVSHKILHKLVDHWIWYVWFLAIVVRYKGGDIRVVPEQNAEPERDKETDPISEGLSPLPCHGGQGLEWKPFSHLGRRSRKKKKGGPLPLLPVAPECHRGPSSSPSSSPTTSPPSPPTLHPSMQRCNLSLTRWNLYLNMVLNAIYYFPMMYGYPMMFE